MHSMWLQDAKINRSIVNGKPKYTLRIPEVFMRAIESEEGLEVALFLEDRNLKVIPYEKERNE
ncbi:hypothetical protein TRIP_E230115 [uncultured Spirochaetota bacterium]|uniref:Uncharacterized protein n=1 Tax=uncultured Spirochaetota bacterium TaxID=460511 RepID=A0A652ZVY8_9SPIR|nr:hypothetical protein TRIP_E230115 [uncultured Spirochaetota bacterium]